MTAELEPVRAANPADRHDKPLKGVPIHLGVPPSNSPANTAHAALTSSRVSARPCVRRKKRPTHARSGGQPHQGRDTHSPRRISRLVVSSSPALAPGIAARGDSLGSLGHPAGCRFHGPSPRRRPDARLAAGAHRPLRLVPLPRPPPAVGPTSPPDRPPAPPSGPRPPGCRRTHLPRPLRRRRRPGQDRLAAQPALQVVGQRRGRRRSAAPGPSPGTSGRSSPGRGRPPGSTARGRAGSCSSTCSSVSSGVAAAERRPAGEQLVQDRPQAVDVGRRRQPLLAAGLLRGHVRRRADDRPGLRQAGVALDPLGQPEVGDVRLCRRRRAGCWPASGRGAGCRAGGRGGRPGRPSPAAAAAAARVRGQLGDLARRGCRPRPASCEK